MGETWERDTLGGSVNGRDMGEGYFSRVYKQERHERGIL